LVARRCVPRFERWSCPRERTHVGFLAEVTARTWARSAEEVGGASSLLPMLASRASFHPPLEMEEPDSHHHDVIGDRSTRILGLEGCRVERFEGEADGPSTL
jgi:hypothetical protein